MKSIQRLFIMIFALALLISACNVPKALSEEDKQKTVQMVAQQTLGALETQNAAQPSVTPLAPTNTPQAVSTNTLPPLPSTPSLTPSLTPSPSPTALCNRAGFVDDVTVKDGENFAPNMTFTKTWRLKNNGTCTWSSGYAIVFDSGNAMGYTSPVFLTGNVAPGATVDLSVNLKAPGSSGAYTGNFKLRDTSGVLFGLGTAADSPFWVKINVAEPGAFKAYDFVAHVCDASWRSGAGSLPCPGSDTDSNGFVLTYATPKWETGATDDEAAIETHPQWIDNGEIAGKYPAFRVQSGDHFKAVIGCRYGGTNCKVRYFLNYSIGGGMEGNLNIWDQTYDGTLTTIDVDLTPLAGSDVNFILRISANGSSAQDWALWLQPRIMR